MAPTSRTLITSQEAGVDRGALYADGSCINLASSISQSAVSMHQDHRFPQFLRSSH